MLAAIIKASKLFLVGTDLSLPGHFGGRLLGVGPGFLAMDDRQQFEGLPDSLIRFASGVASASVKE